MTACNICKWPELDAIHNESISYSRVNDEQKYTTLLCKLRYSENLKKVFLKILEKSQENTCVGVSKFIVNLAKFLRTPFIPNTSRRLLLYFIEGRKKPLHSKLERTKLIWDTVMFLLETFIQNLVLGFFGLKKIRCKTRKRHTQTVYQCSFYIMLDLDLTYQGLSSESFLHLVIGRCP